MMKYLIIDDEPMAHEIIKGYGDLLPNLELMKHCYDAIEALDFLRTTTVDLIFLDLNMPKLKGFEFLKTLSQPPKVIVTTAYKEYALEGYELNITDYLLKPFSFERFLKAVNKVSEAIEPVPPVVYGQSHIEEARLFLHANKTHIQVKIADILFVEAEGNYSKVVFADKNILVREKISEMSQMLSATECIQVHKSYLVSIRHIEKIEGNRMTCGGFTIPIGKTYKAQVVALLNAQ